MHRNLAAYSTYLLAAVSATARLASAEVIEFGNGQKEQWENAVGEYTTITFTEFPNNTLIVDQYASLGIHFTNGGVVTSPNWDAFPEDGAGIVHPYAGSPMLLTFDEPMTHIAIDFPGFAQFELYSDGELIHISDEFGGAGAGNFAGLSSTEPFDQVYIEDWLLEAWVSLDNLHFGPSIPAPGALALFPLTLIGSTRRRTI
jgi:hypothetical protein